MLGDTIDIKADERRYNQLISQGMLPSAVIKKIETEKRLGIGTKPKEDTEWNITVVKIAIVGLILITGYSIIKKRFVSPSPIPSPTLSPYTMSSIVPISIDTIQGIDLNTLSICRQRGLM